MPTPSTSQRRRHPVVRRVSALVGLVAVGGLVLLATTVGVERLRADDGDDAIAATTLKTATLDSGSLSTSESIDATVALSSTTDVLHRIEGQASSSVVGSDTSSTSSSDSSSSSGPFAPAAFVRTDALPVDEPCITDPSTSTSSTSTSVPPPIGVFGEARPITFDTPTTTEPSSSTTSTTDPSTTSTSSTSTTEDTVPAATSSTTSSTTTPSTTPATVPATPTTSTPACDPTSVPSTSTTSTTLPETATTAVGGPQAPTGPGPTGGSTTANGGASTDASTDGSSNGTTTRITQTVTSVIAIGTTVSLGDELYTVDGHAVVALTGKLPAWRTLDVDSDDGLDVLQLETSLAALGYDPDATMTIDETFDDDTEAVVEAWQAGSGQEVSGSVALGSVVFLPATATVSDVSASVGDAVGDGDTILTLSAPAQSVVIDVPAGTESIIVPGLVVGIGDAEGTVSYLRSVERDGAVVVQAVITPSSTLEGVSNGSSTKVRVTVAGADGVVLAPAEALASRLDGSYALQVVRSDGSEEWVTVTVLGVAGSKVGVRGDGIAAGTTVLMPG